MEETKFQSMICDALHDEIQRQRDLSGAYQSQTATVVDPEDP
jgi:hypothetical protein